MKIKKGKYVTTIENDTTGIRFEVAHDSEQGGWYVLYRHHASCETIAMVPTKAMALHGAIKALSTGSVDLDRLRAIVRGAAPCLK